MVCAGGRRTRSSAFQSRAATYIGRVSGARTADHDQVISHLPDDVFARLDLNPQVTNAEAKLRQVAGALRINPRLIERS